MQTPYTPLRYPGGKAKLGPFLTQLFSANQLTDGAYVEPYAGGAGAALHLLFRGYASRIYLNDLDRGVVSFWRAVLNHSQTFAQRIRSIPLTVQEWDRQRLALRTARMGFDLGFAFFYLNRTNRSGILNGGIIGGRHQTGPWGIDARFNRENLARRVEAIGNMRRQISICRADALTFASSMARELRRSKVLFYFDPPYFHKGQQLYLNHYKASDHAKIAKWLGGFRRPWLLTYDDCPEIRALYARRRILESEVSYSAREVRRGREIVVKSAELRLPTTIPTSGTYAPGFELV